MTFATYKLWLTDKSKEDSVVTLAGDDATWDSQPESAPGAGDATVGESDPTDDTKLFGWITANSLCDYKKVEKWQDVWNNPTLPATHVGSHSTKLEVHFSTQTDFDGVTTTFDRVWTLPTADGQFQADGSDDMEATKFAELKTALETHCIDEEFGTPIVVNSAKYVGTANSNP